MQVQQQYLAVGNQLMAQTANQLSEVHAALGNDQQAAKYSQAVLNAIVLCYSCNSTAVAFQHLKLASQVSASGDKLTALEHLNAAAPILNVHFGEHSWH